MIQCDAPGCVRGIVHHPGGWGNPCTVCSGRGELHLAEVARLIDENEQTLTRLLRGRQKMRVKTCTRILDGVLKLITPPKQPEMFA